jgi:hypothetical protein
LLGVAAISACAGAAMSGFAIPPARAQNAQPWEYLCHESSGFTVPDEKEVTTQLNEAGKEGWELVSLSVFGLHAHYCLKRPAS